MSIKKENIDKLISSYSVNYKITKDEAWSDMLNSIETKSVSTPVKSIKYNRVIISAAASITLLVAISLFWIKSSYQEFYTTNGTTQEIVLPDNSTVILNSDSHLSYSKLVWKVKRNVKLDGEAYFIVTPGEKFIVKSDIAEVKVLGTEFNTFSRGDIFELKCYSGKVKLNYQDKEQVLTKDQAYVVYNSKQEGRKYNFDSNAQKDWRNGEFFFENKRLEFVLDELARQFDVELIIPESIKDRLYTGYFSNENMDDALVGICLPMQLSYKISGNKVTLVNEK